MSLLSLVSKSFGELYTRSSVLFSSPRQKRAAVIVLAALLMFAIGATAQTTYTVTNLNDSGPGSLRDAITSANANSGSTIQFDPALTGTITLTSGALQITAPTNIQGPGANVLSVSGNNTSQIFLQNSTTGSVTISGLTIQGGYAAGSGGGITNTGTLLLTNCTVTANSAATGGGGLLNSGTATVTNSTFTGNAGGTAGGGILNSGTLTVTNSTFANNTAANGAGLMTSGAGDVVVTNSTFASNSGSLGAGIYNSNTITLFNSIVAGNTSSSSAGDDCDGCGTQDSHNLISSASNIVDPLLAAPGNFGGPTQTMLPMYGSPGIGAGLYQSGEPATDQRGVNRPTAGAIDLGAVQTQFLIVTTMADQIDSSPDCTSGTGNTCSLRDAISTLNSNGTNQIVFASGLQGTITLSNGTLQLQANATITGPANVGGTPQIIVDAGGASEVFTVGSGLTAMISNLTITNGTRGIANAGVLTLSSSVVSNNVSIDSGAGISNSGTLTVTNSTFNGNFTTAGSGGAIYSSGSLSVVNTSFTSNNAYVSGGGVAANSATLVGSLFSNNSTNVNGGGGGGAIADLGALNAVDCTITGNSAPAGGGVLFSGTSLVITNSTISGNYITGDANAGNGGGILNNSGNSAQLANTIVSGNFDFATSAVDDITGAYSDNGGNLIGSTSVSLSALGNYGGPTQTVVPLPGSSAICAGDASVLNGLTLDQRGFARTTSYGGTTCLDSGAVQTNYSLAFSSANPAFNGQPAPIPPATAIRTGENFSAAVLITENGAQFPVSGVTLPLTLSLSQGTGNLTGTTPAVSNGIATYDALQLDTVGNSDELTASLQLTAVGATPLISIAATSNPFNVALPPVNVTVNTAPSGLALTVDGVSSGSQVFTWEVGSQHTLAVTTPQSGGVGVEYVFSNWSDGTLTATDTITVSSGVTSYNANFATNYLLSVSAGLGGTVTPDTTGTLYLAGTAVALTATPNPGFRFVGWSGSTDIADPTSSSTSITMNAPKTVTATFAVLPSFVVTVNSDTTTGTASNCTDQSQQGATPDANCSLRDALAAAQAATGGHITFSPAVFLSGGGSNTITLAHGALNLPDRTTVTGLVDATQNPLVTIDAAGASTAVALASNTTASIANVVIMNGSASSTSVSSWSPVGGGIYNAGTLTLTNCTVKNNTSTTDGAGLFNDGVVTITGSTFDSNSVVIYGGGAFNSTTGQMNITNSKFSNNSAQAGGGGIYDLGGTINVSSSTFGNNAASATDGGAISSAGTAQIVNSTFAGNISAGCGGGALIESGTLRNSTFYANTAGAAGGGGICTHNSISLANNIASGNASTNGPDDITGNYTDLGGNVIGVIGGTTLNANPITLAQLGNYGGPTPTLIPLPGSPAICAGDLSQLNSLTTDQRGLPRTAAYGSTTCVDAGAVQSNYSLTFSAPSLGFNGEPAPISPATFILLNTNFTAAAMLQESGQAFTVPGVSIPLTLTGTGVLSGGTASTNASGIANYTALQVSQSGTGNTLTANLTLNGTLSISAQSSAFDVQPEQVVVTLSFTPSSLTYGSSVSGALNAAATLGGTPVSGTFAYTYAPQGGGTAQTLVPASTILPAGAYTITATFTPTDTTLQPQSATADITITPASLTITADNQTKTYGQTLNLGNTAFVAAGLINGDSATSITLTSTGAASTAHVSSSPYAIVPSAAVGSNLSNYSITYANGLLTVNPAALTVAANNATKVYGTTDPAFTYQITNGTLLNGDTLAGTLTRAPGENVGNYAIQQGTLAASPSASDYNMTFVPGTFSITPAPATIVLSNLTQTYDGTPKAVTVTSLVSYMVTYTGISPTVYTTSVTPPTEPGSYSVVATVTDPNYVGGTTGTLTINQITGNFGLSLLTGMPEPSPYGTRVYFELSQPTTPCPTGQVQFFVDGSLDSTVTLTGASCASPIEYQNPVLAPGTHSIYAVYSGDTNYTGATSNTVSHQVVADATMITMATSASTINVGQSVTFTATVSLQNAVDGTAQSPAGNVQFLDAGNLLGSAPLDTTTVPYTAAFTTSSLAAGSHSVYAIYVSSNGLYSGSTSAVDIQTVNKIVPTISWTPVTATIVYGTPLGADQLNATASDSGNPVSGTFTYDPVSGTVPLVGQRTITVTFTPTDGATYSTQTASVTITVQPATLTVTPDNQSRAYGADNPTFTYQITGFLNGDTDSIVTGTPAVTSSATATSAVGSYPITAAVGTLAAPNYTFTYTPGALTVTQATASVTPNAASKTYGATDPAFTGTLSGFLAGDNVTATYTRSAGETVVGGPYTISATLAPAAVLGNYNVTYNTAQLMITPASSGTTISSNVSAVLLKNTVTLTAHVSSTAGTPTGNVNFMEGSTSVATGTLDSNGNASVNVTTLSAGSHSITAAYAGDGNFNASTSTAVSELVQDFAFSTGGSSVVSATVRTGDIASYAVSIGLANGTTFPSAVTLTLTGLPAGATYTITPATIPAGSGAQNIIIKVQTGTSLATTKRANGLGVMFAIAIVPMFGMITLRRKARVVVMLALVLLIMMGLGATGCGWHVNPAKNYTMTLTATSGSLSHSTPLTLNIQAY